ncbi:MAG: hypothetical protein ACLFM0_03045 [Spirochaetales bacterium]
MFSAPEGIVRRASVLERLPAGIIALKKTAESKKDRFGFSDRLLMIAAAVWILIPILGALLGAVLVAWLLFSLFFG